MKKYKLWKQLHAENQEALVIDPGDIVKKVSFAQELVYKFHADEIDENDIKKLESLLPALKSIGWDPETIEELFRKAGFKPERVGDSEDYSSDALYYFHDCNYLGTMNDCEPVPVYEYWDGSNWRELWFDEVNMEEMEVVIQEVTDNLDEWDGNNWNYGGKFSHGRIYQIKESDGEEVKGKYLLYTYTDYQGDIPRGKIITSEEREEILSALSHSS